MKIAFLSHLDLNLALFRKPVMRELLRQGHEVYAVVPPGGYAGALEEMGVKVAHYALQRRSLNPFKEFAVVMRLRSLFREIDPQIVHAFTHKPNLYAAMSASAPVVQTVTGLGSYFIDSSWRSRAVRKAISWLYRASLGGVEKVIFQNADDLRLFVEEGIVPASKAVLVRGSGVDTREFAPRQIDDREKEAMGLDPSLPVVLMIARVIREKGVREYLEAARRIGERAQFLYIGEIDRGNPGAFDPDWQGVRYLGFREDVASWIALSDLVVLPSYREGLPRTLLEAAAMGKPIVTTDVPGCREAVREGENGLLVPSQDAEALVDAITRLLEDPERMRRMGLRGRQMALEEFSARKVVSEYLSIYQEILGENDALL